MVIWVPVLIACMLIDVNDAQSHGDLSSSEQITQITDTIMSDLIILNCVVPTIVTTT